MKVHHQLLLVTLTLLPICGFGFDELRVAAAADTQFVLPQIATAFEQRTGDKVVLSFGSSGNLSAQIQNGAPFDVFLSADTEYARKLVDGGLADAASLYQYAEGELVLWVPANSALDPSQGIDILRDSGIRRIAIANPQHAPYGRAAVAALQHAGIYDAIRSKLVLGENIAQVFQFVSSGNADIGLLSLSLVEASQAHGKYSLISESLYPPIQQSAVALKNSSHRAAANAFLEFLKTSEAKTMLQKSGLAPPRPSPAAPGEKQP